MPKIDRDWKMNLIYKPQEIMDKKAYEKLIEESEKEIATLDSNALYISKRMADLGADLTEKYDRINELKCRIAYIQQTIKDQKLE